MNVRLSISLTAACMLTTYTMPQLSQTGPSRARPAEAPARLERTLTQLLRLAHTALAFDLGRVLLVDRQAGDVRLVAAYADREPQPFSAAVQALPTHGAMQELVERGQALQRQGSDLDSLPILFSPPARYQAYLAVPVLDETGSVIGILDFLRHAPSAFDTRDLDLAVSLADQAAAALERAQLEGENARLQETVREDHALIARQLTQQRALHDLMTQLNVELSLERELEVLLSTVRDVFHADAGAIFLRPLGGYGFRHVASQGLSDNYITTLQRSYMNGPSGIAIATRKPVVIEDTRSDPRMGALAAPARGDGIASLVKLPCIYRDEVLGFLGLHHHQRQHYSDNDKFLMQTFADQAAIAIKNAQLHESTVETATRLNTVIEAVSAPLVAYDDDNRVLLANQPFYQLVGLDPALFHLEGLTLDEVLTLASNFRPTLPDRESLASLISPDDDEGDELSAIEIESAALGRIFQRVASPIAGPDGKTRGCLLMYHDVTTLRESERMKDELVALLSHELRTPLTSILGYANLLADRPEASAERRAKWARFVLDKSRLLARLIDEVLDLSRLSARRLPLQRQPTDLLALVSRVVDEVGVTTDHHTFIIEAPDDLPPVSVDGVRLNQALTNLLDNAVKYWPEGGAVRVKLALVDGGSGTGDEGKRDAGDGTRPGRSTPMVQISVIDHGPGIPDEQREQIFEPFSRLDHRTSRQAYGLGLGLALTRGIIQAHGGHIHVAPTPGGGSTFRFTLPVTA